MDGAGDEAGCYRNWRKMNEMNPSAEEKNSLSEAQNNKIKRLEEIYDEFIKLCKPRGTDISFSDLYIQDQLGWDTYIKYYFLTQGLRRKLFVLTAFNTRSDRSKNTYKQAMAFKTIAFFELMRMQSIVKSLFLSMEAHTKTANLRKPLILKIL